jgi:hypothetical protein
VNGTQREYVQKVRAGEIPPEDVCADLMDLDEEAYTKPGFREMLFAIDATNRIEGREWQTVFNRGFIENAVWTPRGALEPEAYTEIGAYHEAFGYGEYGLRLVIDMYEEIPRKPVNATSFTRRTIREFFNGVQPITERVLFLLKRFYGKRAPMNADDIKLLFHVREETKGLDNVEGFDHFFRKTIVDWLTDDEEGINGRHLRLVLWHLSAADEITPAEQSLIRALKDEAIALPSALLAHIDLRRDRLAGMA